MEEHLESNLFSEEMINEVTILIKQWNNILQEKWPIDLRTKHYIDE